MKSKVKIAGMLAILIFLAGCASIVSKTMYPVTINSHPDEAIILIEDERGKQMYKGTTPATITLAAGEAYFHGKSYTVTFSKSGYEKQVAVIKAEMDGWYIGNILFGGLIGILIVDPLTGAMWKLPNELTVTLVKGVASIEGDKALKIVTIDQIAEDLKEHLIRIN